MLLSALCVDKAMAAVTPISGYTTPQISTEENPVWYTMMSSHLTETDRQYRYMLYDGSDPVTEQHRSGLAQEDITDAYLWRLESAGDGTATHVYIINRQSGLRILVPAGATAEDGTAGLNTQLDMAEEGSVWDLKTSESTGISTDCADGQYVFQYVDYSGNRAFLNAMGSGSGYGITIFDRGVQQASGWFFYEYIEPVQTPEFSPADGEVFVTEDPVTITITTETEDAQIYYTKDGTEPSADNGTLYVDGVEITESCTVKAIAVKEGLRDSDVASATYQITAPGVEIVVDPVFSPVSGESFVTLDPVTITITTETEDAQIYYTKDGTEPSADNGTLYVDGVEITESCTIKAIAVKEGMTSSRVVSASYEVSEPQYCTSNLTVTRTDRYLRSITMEGGLEPFTISSIESANSRPLYHDYTSSVLRAYPGTEIQPEISWNGEWMHGYLYIDYDGDRAFSYEVNADGTPAEGSEVVSHTYYKEQSASEGHNSLGEVTASDSKLGNVPAFTIPEDLEPGQYRVRFKVDWNYLDPCGDTKLNESGQPTIAANAGCIVDFTLQVEKPDYVVTVAANDNGMGIVYIGEEGTTETTSSYDGTGTLELTAVAAEGYRFDGWFLGEDKVSDEAVYTTTAITEDRDYVANFSFIPVSPRNIQIVSNNGEKGLVNILEPEALAENGISDKTVNTGERVVLEAVPAQDYFFKNWVNAEDEEIGTEPIYAYDATEEGYVKAVFIGRYTVTVDNTTPNDGDVTVTYTEGGNLVQPDDQIDEGTSVTVTVDPNYQKELGSLLVNGEECAGEYDGGYTFTVEGDTEIEVAFVSETFNLQYSYNGSGYIEIWSSYDESTGDPLGEQYSYGDEVPAGNVYIFAMPQGNAAIESITVNGEPIELGELEEYGSIELLVEEDVNIVATFTGEDLSGVEEAAADAVKVYSAAGAIVIESGEAVSADIYTAGGVLVKSVTAIAGTDRIEVPDGIYMVKVGAKVLKVAVR